MPNDATMTVVRTLRFDAATPADADKRMTSKTWYTDPTGAFKTGFWAAQPGRADIHYTKDEMCVLIEGEVRLTDAAGHVETYVAGDTFMIPKGFKGVWETVRPVRKFYAIYNPG